MKKYILIIAAVTAAVTLIASGCGDNNETKSETKPSASASTETTPPTTAEETTKPETETEKETEETKETVPETAAEETTNVPSADYNKILTEKKWYCEKCVKDGKTINIQDYYGSVIKETGTYIQFNNDGTFKCIMGFEGCEGTYTVSDSGTVTVNKTMLYTATKEKKVNQTETLKTEGDNDIESITIKLNGVNITFA